MRICTDPAGHDWEDTSFTIKAGSTPVVCMNCGESGFRIEGAPDDRH